MRSKDFDSIKPYSYYLRDKETDLKYFGIRWRNVKANRTPREDFGVHYFSSGKLKNVFKKNLERFDFKLVATFDTIDELRSHEIKITKKIYKNKSWANQNAYPAIHYDVHPQLGKKQSKETREKISKKLKGRKFSLETKRKMSLANKGSNNSMYGVRRVFTEEHRKKISEGNKGRKLSKETKSKITEKATGRKLDERFKIARSIIMREEYASGKRKPARGMLGKKHSDITKANNSLKLREMYSKGLIVPSNAFKGKKHSIQTKEILRQKRLGKKHSAETLKKMSIANSGKNNPNFGKKRPYTPLETRQKLSKALKGRLFSDEHKRKISEAQTGIKRSKEQYIKMVETKKRNGIKFSKEAREKISLALKNRKRSKETYEKIANSNRGKRRSQEQIDKISKALKGRVAWNKGKKGLYKHSDETKNKMSRIRQGSNNPNYGKRHKFGPMSEEHKRKISLSNKGKKHSDSTKLKMSKIALENSRLNKIGK